jgi:hypothetical protein
VAVSNKVLQQFAVNLGALLSGSATADPTAPAAVKTAVPSPMGGELNAMSLMPEPVRKYGPVAGIFLAGMVEGWLVSRAFGRR